MEFYSLKSELQDWLDKEGITNARAYGLGKGHHGAKISFSDVNGVDEFLKKYPKIETRHYNGWLTSCGSYGLYVSMRKK